MISLHDPVSAPAAPVPSAPDRDDPTLFHCFVEMEDDSHFDFEFALPADTYGGIPVIYTIPYVQSMALRLARENADRRKKTRGKAIAHVTLGFSASIS
jgi:hypothetical protein